MLRGWLLPDSSYEVLHEGWERPPYRPRHGKPPLYVRAGQAVSTAVTVARERYWGAAEEDALTGAPRPAS